MLTSMDLPPLDAAEAAHSARVRAHVDARIAAAGGWLPFAAYMHEVLYAPGLGYYAAGATKFGRGGDFVTAPELGSLFAASVAETAAAVITAIDDAEVVEFGAGSGALAADMLAALADRDALPARYRILEVSPDLRERQRVTLAARVPAMIARVEWLDAWPAEPVHGVLLGNEVLDALPVERFRIVDDGIEQLGVAGPGDWTLAWRPASTALTTAVRAVEASLPSPLPTGYIAEWSPWLAPWITGAAQALARGLLLLVDYGLPRTQYYHPSRATGSLVGYHRHRQLGDPLLRPGLVDLTAWVDFTAVAEAAVDAGLDVAGYTTQAHFLLDTGIGQRLEAALAAVDATARATLAQQGARLLLPAEMGEHFKVIALTRGVDGALPGFRGRDLTDTL